jgi:hypothetical protein
MVEPSWESFQNLNSEENTLENKGIPFKEKEQSEEEKQLDWSSFLNNDTYRYKEEPGQLENFVQDLSGLAATAFSYANPVTRAGDVLAFAENTLAKIPDSDTGLGEAIRDFIGKERWEDFVYGTSNATTSLPPSSHKLKEGIDVVTGGYTKPRGKWTSIAQNTAADIAALRGRGGGTTTSRRLINNVGIPVAANAAKETVEGLGFNEEKGDWAKLATWVSLNLATNINGSGFAAELMNEGRQGFNNNVRANVPRMQNTLNNIQNNFSAGDPRSALAAQTIDNIRIDIQNGQIGINDLMRRYDAINAAKRDRGLFQLNRADRRAAVRNINQVRDAVREEIHAIGNPVNPNAIRSWQNGVNAFSAIHRSEAIGNFTKNLFNSPNAKLAATPLAALFGYGGAKLAGLPAAITGGAAVVAPAAYKTMQIAQRVYSDPNLARYYWQAMSAAAAENSEVFLKNYNKLNSNYEKKFKDK